MAGFEINFPDVAYDTELQETYNKLIADDGNSIFSGRTMAEVFIYAMALGVKNNCPKQLNKRAPNLPPDAFSERMRWYMRAVAITDSEELEIFTDHKKVLDIAEKYANGGMKYLLQMIEDQITGEDVESIFETKVRDELKNL